MISMRYEDTDKLEVFLGQLETECRKAGEDIRRESAEVIKEKTVGQLNRVRSGVNGQKYKHMADDVQIRKAKDKYGDEVTKVQGGKNTGTKWHLVNDGTYKTNATHFMDKALNESESQIEKIIDAVISFSGIGD